LGRLGLEEKLGELVEGGFCHPALGALAGLLGRDESGAGQLLQVVRNRGMPDSQALSQLTDAKPHAGTGVAVHPFATTREPQEDRQAVGVSQGLEGSGEFTYFYTSKNIELSIYRKRNFSSPLWLTPRSELAKRASCRCRQQWMRRLENPL
jgi:hypothetical protein